MGTTLNFSTSFHPQTNGQTEVVNNGVETYLRCFTSEHSKRWVDWLFLFEWCCNTSDHSAIGMTPYMDIYGKDPPTLKHYMSNNISDTGVWSLAQEKAEVLHLLKGQLLNARVGMKKIC